jgi:tetratricopeptide (TPR) repeat protein
MFSILSLILALAMPVPQQSFRIMGQIRDGRGSPVGNLRVSLTDEDYQPLKTLFADNTGRFTFGGLKSGRYTLKIETTGTPFEEQSQVLEFQSSNARSGAGEEPFMVEVILRPKKGATSANERGVIFSQDVPPAANSEFERGAREIKSNRIEPGIEALKKAIEIFPQYFLALEMLGTEQVKRGNYEEAVPLLTTAIEVNRSAPKSLYALGVAQLKLNRQDESIESLKASLEFDPQNANAYMMLGIAQGNKKLFDESEGSFRKAYELGRERLPEVHLYLAALYNRQERFAAAVAELELFLKEAKDIKNRAQIEEMLSKMKAKAKTAKK